MNELGFYKGDILIPNENLLPLFSVVACDQFTSQPEYWDEVEKKVGDNPSAYNMVFPEAYLEKLDFTKKIKAINSAIDSYLKKEIFDSYKNSLVYVERTLKSGAVRRGIVGLIDLECYDYNKGSQSLVRATEGTVLERIPPRVKIRENAKLESPHILILIDDVKKTVIEPMGEDKANLNKLYDFDLMMDGGNIKGFLLEDEEYKKVAKALTKLGDKKAFEKRYNVKDKDVLLYAVGDGNHSLATAKECWNNLKKKLKKGEIENHPARYALVELSNLHDPSLEFEAIHRAVFDVNKKDFLKELKAYADKKVEKCPNTPQKVVILDNGKEKELIIKAPNHTLAVGSIQNFLDEYIAEKGGKVDYIHGEDVTRNLSKNGAIGILLPVMQKSELFKTVIEEGALPRKTFSMGEACEKRYYLECRKIK